MPELYSSSLNPSGPNYEAWQRIFGENQVPLKSAHSQKATLGEHKDVEVYLLNLDAMTLGQRARLLGFIAQKFGVPIYKVQAQVAKDVSLFARRM